MNKVLVNGLGTASELGICKACNLDFSWLFRNPSTLLWADEICIPKNAFLLAKKHNESKSEKVISMFLNMAENHGLIREIELSNMYQDSEGEKIYEHASLISESLIDTFPSVIKKGNPGVPGEIVIEENEYCGARIASILLGIKLANDINANCLFSKREHTALKYIYGLDRNRHGGIGVSNAYNEVFSLYLPENLGIHHYAFINEDKCQTCKHYDKCKNNYLIDTENAINKMLKWRDFDELQQAKAEIDRIIKIKGQISSDDDVNDVIRMFKERQDVINKNINKRFPKIERWTKMTTVLATPVTIASAITGDIPLTIASSVVAGASQITQELLEIYKSKNSWVGFVNSMKEM